MPKLPMLSGLETIKALAKAGFKTKRQRGSHVSLFRETKNGPVIVVVPLHKELRVGTLRAIVRQAGLSIEEFAALLK